MNSSSREGFYFFSTISGRQSATASTSLLYHIVVAQVEAVLLRNVCPSGNCFMASLIAVRHLANHFFQNFFTSEVERPPNTGKCDDPQRFLQVVDSLIFGLINFSDIFTVIDVVNFSDIFTVIDVVNLHKLQHHFFGM